MTETVPGVTHIDVVEMRALGDELSAQAGELRGRASGVDRHVPPVPHDPIGLQSLIVRYDEAREGFDRRVADLLDGAGEQAIVQVLDACRADAGLPFIPLPESAR